MKKLLLVLTPILLIIAIIFLWLNSKKEVITNFDTCAKNHPVMESYPARCTANGKTYVQDVPFIEVPKAEELPKSEVIIESPLANTKVGSPLTIKGMAKGNWFFEGKLVIKLYDGNRKLIGQGAGTSSSDWMTTNLIPFSAELQFTVPTTPKGTLIIEKDNPSGEVENAGQVAIPLQF